MTFTSAISAVKPFVTPNNGWVTILYWICLVVLILCFLRPLLAGIHTHSSAPIPSLQIKQEQSVHQFSPIPYRGWTSLI